MNFDTKFNQKTQKKDQKIIKNQQKSQGKILKKHGK